MKKHFCFNFFFIIDIYLSLAGCFSLSQLKAQEFDIKNYTTKDGLSSSYVLSVNQDKLGYLWLGTPNGVNRFNGKDFINYGTEEGLPDSRSVALYMDSHFRGWVSTARGMAELKGDKFVTYPLSDSAKLRGSNIIETKKGQIWALTNVGAYEFRNEKWWKIKLYPGYENNNCREIVETKDGIYINYGDILILQKPDHSYKIVAPHNELAYYYLNLRQYDDKIFISTIEGLNRIKNECLEKLPGELGKLKGVYSYFCDSKKRFWIGNESMGLRMMKPGDTTHFVQVYKRPLINLVSAITEDNHGNIWTADYYGLVKITEAKYTIFTSPQITDSPSVRNTLQPP